MGDKEIEIPLDTVSLSTNFESKNHEMGNDFFGGFDYNEEEEQKIKEEESENEESEDDDLEKIEEYKTKEINDLLKKKKIDFIFSNENLGKSEIVRNSFGGVTWQNKKYVGLKEEQVVDLIDQLSNLYEELMDRTVRQFIRTYTFITFEYEQKKIYQENDEETVNNHYENYINKLKEILQEFSVQCYPKVNYDNALQPLLQERDELIAESKN
jgi:hypothetical protein